MSRDTYSDRERAIRAEIERQAPQFRLKYVMEDNHTVYAAFEFGGGPKGFTTASRTQFELDPKPPIEIAAQILASVKLYDATDWAAP